LRRYKDAQFIISTHSPRPARIPRRADPLLRPRPCPSDCLRRDRPHADRARLRKRPRQFLEELFQEAPLLFEKFNID
jgi:hypothetical protein